MKTKKKRKTAMSEEVLMRKKGKLVWATGISGCGRKEHLENWQKYCEKKGKRVKIYHVGRMLFDWARKNNIKINPEKVLNTYSPVMNALRGGVLEMIKSCLAQDLVDYDAVVVSLHAKFYWQQTYIEVWVEPYIKEFKPDLFVCFIDAGEDILERLKGREQWQDQNLTEKDVLLWQNIEVDETRRYSRLFNWDKKFFVLPVKQPVETLHHLLFESHRPILYIQMPITHLLNEPEELDKVKDLVKKLWRWFIVFNPLTIETGKVDMKCHEEVLARHFQTVNRDLFWFIPQCDICLAYYVKIVFTAGVVDETIEAYHANKEVWVIFPESFTSPFLSYRARVFRSVDEFMEFLKTWRIERKKK